MRLRSKGRSTARQKADPTLVAAGAGFSASARCAVADGTDSRGLLFTFLTMPSRCRVDLLRSTSNTGQEMRVSPGRNARNNGGQHQRDDAHLNQCQKQKPRAREPSRDDVGCGFFDKRAARGRRGEPNPNTQHHDQRNLCPQHFANQIAKPMDQSTDAE